MLKIQVQSAKDLSDAIAEQERKAANNLHEVKVALEQSHLQSKVEFETVISQQKAAFEAAIAEQKMIAANDLHEVKLALEKSHLTAKIALEAAIAEQKVQASKELNEFKVEVEESQEQAKVSLHDKWCWINIFSSLLSFLYSFWLS